MKRLISIVLAMTMLLYGLTAFAGGDGAYDSILSKGELVIGLDDSCPPLSSSDGSGEAVGFNADVAREICSRMGVEPVIKLMPLDDMLMDLNIGTIDCAFGYTITEDLQQMLSFSEPYLNSAQVIVVRGDSDAATLADLAGKNLGARVSFSALTALDANKQFRNSVNVKDEFSDNESMLNELESGNLDAALIDAVVADYYIAQNGDSLRKLDEVLTHEDHAIGFRMSDSSLIENVNRILHEMADDGTLAGISTKWLGADITAIQSNALDTENTTDADAAAENAQAIVPDKALFIGNSLLVGFGSFGMCASDSNHDYYHYVTAAMHSLNPDFTSDKAVGIPLEKATSDEEQDAAYAEIAGKISDDLDFIMMQLSDNTNNDASIAYLTAGGAKRLLEKLHADAPDAYIVWAAAWYSSEEKLDAIKQACEDTGCMFIDFSDLYTDENKSAVGNTITYNDGSQSTVEDAGVASHPGDAGMQAIAERMLEKLGIDNQPQ